MAKTCSSCGYQPIGPFTDNCPLGAEPVQSGFERGHASGRSSAVWWALIGAAVLLCCVGYYGFGQWRGGRAARDVKKEIARLEAHAEADRKARTVTVLAAQLLHEFQGDPVAADQKYRRKHLEISGVVERTGAPPGAVPFVILHAGDEGSKLRIECFFDFAGEEGGGQIGRLSKGQTVTVCGEYSGQISNVQVWGCALMK